MCMCMTFLSVEVLTKIANTDMKSQDILYTSENIGVSLEWFAGANESCASKYVVTCEIHIVSCEGQGYRQLDFLYINLTSSFYIIPFMSVAYNKDLLYMLCVTAFCQSRIKSICQDDCVLRCNTVPFSRWLPVFVATQCLHFQGWRVSYILKAGILCSYDMFIPAYQTTWCHTVEHHSVRFHCHEMSHLK